LLLHLRHRDAKLNYSCHNKRVIAMQNFGIGTLVNKQRLRSQNFQKQSLHGADIASDFSAASSIIRARFIALKNALQ